MPKRLRLLWRRLSRTPIVTTLVPLLLLVALLLIALLLIALLLIALRWVTTLLWIALLLVLLWRRLLVLLLRIAVLVIALRRRLGWRSVTTVSVRGRRAVSTAVVAGAVALAGVSAVIGHPERSEKTRGKAFRAGSASLFTADAAVVVEQESCCKRGIKSSMGKREIRVRGCASALYF